MFDMQYLSNHARQIGNINGSLIGNHTLLEQ